MISIFDPMLVPTWLHLGFKNLPKSTKNPISEGIKKLIDFCIDFWSILAPFRRPSWSHLGHLFPKKRGTLAEGTRIFSRSLCFCDFFAVLAASGPRFASICEVWGSLLAPFLVSFGSILVLFRAELVLDGLVGLREAQGTQYLLSLDILKSLFSVFWPPEISATVSRPTEPIFRHVQLLSGHQALRSKQKSTLLSKDI